jgi:cytochrome oxidase Cu insertion factor (SCO1/SenC/PrrC family)
VKQRMPRILRLALVFIFLPGMICVLSTSAAAQDHIAPLNVHAGDKAPDFALKDGDGKTVRLSDFKGHDVLLDFFRGYW